MKWIFIPPGHIPEYDGNHGRFPKILWPIPKREYPASQDFSPRGSQWPSRPGSAINCPRGNHGNLPWKFATLGRKIPVVVDLVEFLDGIFATICKSFPFFGVLKMNCHSTELSFILQVSYEPHSIEMDFESNFCFGAAVHQHNSWMEAVNNVCFRLSIHVKDLHDTLFILYTYTLYQKFPQSIMILSSC